MNKNPFLINLELCKDKKYMNDFNKNLIEKTNLKVCFERDKSRDFVEGLIYFNHEKSFYGLPIRKHFSNKDKFLQECSDNALTHLFNDFLVCTFPFYDNGDFNITFKEIDEAVAYIRSEKQFILIYEEKIKKDLTKWIY